MTGNSGNVYLNNRGKARMKIPPNGNSVSDLRSHG
jgi:hypothetical protein